MIYYEKRCLVACVRQCSMFRDMTRINHKSYMEMYTISPALFSDCFEIANAPRCLQIDFLFLIS